MYLFVEVKRDLDNCMCATLYCSVVSIQAIFAVPWPADALVKAIDELLQQTCTKSIPAGGEEVLKSAVKFAAPIGDSLLAKCFGNRAAALLKRKCYRVGAVDWPFHLLLLVKAV